MIINLWQDITPKNSLADDIYLLWHYATDIISWIQYIHPDFNYFELRKSNSSDQEGKTLY